jgi:hypothetical protein
MDSKPRSTVIVADAMTGFQNFFLGDDDPVQRVRLEPDRVGGL